jgi:hypothetical protein
VKSDGDPKALDDIRDELIEAFKAKDASANPRARARAAVPQFWLSGTWHEIKGRRVRLT